MIRDLARLRSTLKESTTGVLRDFFWVAFSETVRRVSNSRNGEFKLYRLAPQKLSAWNPDVLGTFAGVVARNLVGNAAWWARSPLPRATTLACNAMDLSAIEDASFDVTVTSPPYGDSRTTVAYGQFSRLSLQWLELPVSDAAPAPTELDQTMLGGHPKAIARRGLGSPTLDQALDRISLADTERAQEVWAFYQDLDVTLGEMARVTRSGGYQCWVVGNRTVKGIQLETDRIIRELSKAHGVYDVASFSRNIPHKRMPRENSPTNRVGEKVQTMTGEKIFILRKA